MKLLMHNMLSSNIKVARNGFPLAIQVEKFVQKKVNFNPDFLKNMVTKIEWKALVDSSMLKSVEFLHKFHHALLKLHLEEGALVCFEAGRKFPVNKGIPNMLLREDEVAKECEYEMVVSTGPSRGPTYKFLVIIEAIGGKNINTTNIVKQWGNMGRRYTYFLPPIPRIDSKPEASSQGKLLQHLDQRRK